MSIRCRIGPLCLRVEGLEIAAGPTRSWLGSQLSGLPVATGNEPVLELRFVDGLPFPVGGPIFEPIGFAPDGLVVSDQAGRSARLPLPDPCVAPVYVDARMNRYQVEEWVLLPLLRLALERAGATLVRCAAVEIGGRAIAISAPMRTGKTRLLLALLDRGARHLGDDWLALDREGVAHPVFTGLMLRDVHRGQLAGRWPGPADRGRRRLVQVASWLARRTAARWPAVSVGLERVAAAAWVLGFHSVPISALPEVRLGRAAPLGGIVLLRPPAMPPIEAEDVPAVVAGLGELDSRPVQTLAAAFAALHPAVATDPLFRAAGDARDALLAALDGGPVTVFAVGDGPWVDSAAEVILPAAGLT